MQTIMLMMIQTMSAAPARSFGTPAMMPTIPTTDEVKNNTQEEGEAEENENSIDVLCFIVLELK